MIWSFGTILRLGSWEVPGHGLMVLIVAGADFVVDRLVDVVRYIPFDWPRWNREESSGLERNR